MQSPPQSPEQDDSATVTPSLPYYEAYTNALMRTVLEPPEPSGTVVLDKKDRATAVEGVSVRAEDVEFVTVDYGDLPLPLDDPRRIYRSPVPGVNLTQPGGLLEGGGFRPATAEGKTIPPEIQKFAQQYIRSNNIRNQTQMRRSIHAEISRLTGELTKTMNERRMALEQNEKIDGELEQNEAQRAMERRLEERMMSMTKRRRKS